MKNFSISKVRWYAFHSALLELGKGRMDQKLKIRNLNDAFEGVEALFNMVIEELRRRLLHQAFVKPANYQRYTAHYVLVLSKDFRIDNACESFLRHYQEELVCLKQCSFLDITDKDTAVTFVEQYGKATDVTFNEPLHMELFGDRFLCSVSRLAGNGDLVLNLYQVQLRKEDYRPSYEIPDSENTRLLENKRYMEIIEELKKEIDALPLTEKVVLKKIIGKYSINVNLAKKLFKQQYGCGIYEYQIALRMEKAHYLISNTQKSFKEIAAETGYAEYIAFVKYFKKYYNILPRALRKKANSNKIQ